MKKFKIILFLVGLLSCSKLLALESLFFMTEEYPPYNFRDEKKAFDNFNELECYRNSLGD